MEDLPGVVVRISVMYIFTLFVLRLSGKRSIDTITPLDFVVATIIGDLFDDVFWAEVPLAKGAVAVTAVILMHTLVAYFSYRNADFDQLVASTPTQVVADSAFREDGLRKERIRQEEALAQIRLLGEEGLTEIQSASFEPDGRISVQKKEAFKPVQKQDLPALQEMYK